MYLIGILGDRPAVEHIVEVGKKGLHFQHKHTPRKMWCVFSPTD